MKKTKKLCVQLVLKKNSENDTLDDLILHKKPNLHHNNG
jgi:hypothetical protein